MTNGVILLHLLGALMIGVLLGYERSYQGRAAAGMRTDGPICMASTALTVIVAYPPWYGGAGAQWPGAGDPTRVMQTIVTGIGFYAAAIAAVVDWGFHLTNGAGQFEYKLALQANGKPDLTRMVKELSSADGVVEFHLSPSRK